MSMKRKAGEEEGYDIADYSPRPRVQEFRLDFGTSGASLTGQSGRQYRLCGLVNGGDAGSFGDVQLCRSLPDGQIFIAKQIYDRDKQEFFFSPPSLDGFEAGRVVVSHDLIYFHREKESVAVRLSTKTPLTLRECVRIWPDGKEVGDLPCPTTLVAHFDHMRRHQLHEIDVVRQIGFDDGVANYVDHALCVYEDCIQVFLIEQRGGDALIDTPFRKLENLWQTSFPRAFLFLFYTLHHLKTTLGLAHLDLKPDNILFGLVDLCRLTLCDFGMAQFEDIFGIPDKGFGTPFFAAPETFRAEKFDRFAADIWSLAVTICTMLSKLPIAKFGVPDTVQVATNPPMVLHKAIASDAVFAMLCEYQGCDIPQVVVEEDAPLAGPPIAVDDAEVASTSLHFSSSAIDGEQDDGNNKDDDGDDEDALSAADTPPAPVVSENSPPLSSCHQSSPPPPPPPPAAATLNLVGCNHPELNKLLLDMLHPIPARRPTIEEVIRRWILIYPFV